jgi:hypothetical protein
MIQRSDATLETSSVVPFYAVQLIYSTADIERTVFFGEAAGSGAPLVAPVEVDQPTTEPDKLIVVHGEYYLVNRRQSPPGAVPFSIDAGLLRQE